jgi:hypothetical protein
MLEAWQNIFGFQKGRVLLGVSVCAVSSPNIELWLPAFDPRDEFVDPFSLVDDDELKEHGRLFINDRFQALRPLLTLRLL